MKIIETSTIDKFLKTLTGFSPRQFQRQTITRLLNRQDVLLRAPTGSGKTETAIAPFLFVKALNQDFPNKLIYVVPLRTLANSLRQRTNILPCQDILAMEGCGWRSMGFTTIRLDDWRW